MKLVATFALTSSLTLQLLEAACPVFTSSPYRNEASPFGWPVSPNDFDYTTLTQTSTSLTPTNNWASGSKYATCGGVRQSPIDVVFLDDDTDPAFCPRDRYGDDGNMADRAQYLALQGGSMIGVSTYLRTVYAQGQLGTLRLDDVTYMATQIHITSPSFHTSQGQSFAGEIMIVHVPQGQQNGLNGTAVVSIFLADLGDPSGFLADMGFTDDDLPMSPKGQVGGSWPAPQILDVPNLMAPLLAGSFVQYNGSVPVPPCTENVKWFLMANMHSASMNQINKITSTLSCYAGGVTKRKSFPNPPLVSRYTDDDGNIMPKYGTCRKMVMNSLRVGGPHDQETCKALINAGSPAVNLTAACWDTANTQANQSICVASPIDIKKAQAHVEATVAQANSFLYYQPVVEVAVTPSTYSLDISAVNRSNVDNFGTFGYMVLGGRRFEARNISLKAISSHSYDGVYYAGELNIVHTLYGDDLHDLYSAAALATNSVLSGSSSSASSSASAQMVTPSHKVIVTIPVTIGAQNPFLLSLGAGMPGYSGAVASGVGYNIQARIDINASLQSSLTGAFSWYDGGLTTPGCARWGVRWLVFETPIQVSMDQFNLLALPVSGMDSTRVNQTQLPPQNYAGHVWRNSLPAFAADKIRGAEQLCNPVTPWNYANVSCWPTLYPLCSNGRSQSPININTSRLTATGTDKFIGRTGWHPLSGLRVVNSGSSLAVYNEQMGYVMLMGQNGFPSYYQLSQLNLHMPSEHLIDGRQYAAELSIAHKRQTTVYQLDTSDVLVTSFFFNVGPKRNPLLDQLLGTAPLMPGQWSAPSTPVDLLRSLGPALKGSFYRYNGSVTMPPCSEIVKYFVFEEALNMSQDQWLSFKAMFPGLSNNRPAQAVNGRPVLKNSFMEGSLSSFDYYFRRDGGVNREMLGPAWIIAPIVGTIVLAVAVMASVFVKEDRRRRIESAGGLTESIGKNRF